MTTNSQATSESIFGSFRVIYWHPQRHEMAVLALSGPELIQTGTLTALDDHDLRFDMTLLYDQEQISWAPEPTRAISSVWSFDSPTSSTNSWIVDQGQPLDHSMTAWSYSKHVEVTALPASAAAHPEHVNLLNAFLPFLDFAWDTDTTRTTWAWIPYNAAIHVRTLNTDSSDSVAEMIIYPHPHTKAIHTLAMYDTGAIDEGLATVIDDLILIRAKRADHEKSTRIEQRIERLDSGRYRVRTWSNEDADRTLLADATYSAATD